METKDSLRGFAAHGVTFHRTSGNQAIGDCPFCDKENHFFVNVENRLWDCKRCGEKGNFYGFLELVSKNNTVRMGEDPTRLKALAANRRLPVSAFTKWEIGWDGTQYTLPVRGARGTVVDLRRYSLGGKANATSGATLGLLGAHKMVLMPGCDVYVCEGEWDTIALAWLFKKLDTNSVAVGVPGASVFKNEWIELFAGRRVFLMHDNDVAGENGKKLCYGKLKDVATEIKVISWPVNLPQGFDVRDFIALEAVKNAKPRHAWNELKKMLVAPKDSIPSSVPASAAAPVPAFDGKRVKREEVAEAYRKWLHMPSDEPLQIMFGTALANKMQGDPIWLFLIAPPGGSKSELLMSLSKHPAVESTTSLTPHTLVSGANFNNGTDPSLLPKLNNRILVIKDFTTILTMHYTSRDEIFGVLRDCYDGKTEKTFGTGIKRSYSSHFGIIAGVTPKIEEFGVMHQSLGERFLKYRINTGEKTLSEADRIRRALKNINRENQMREELCSVANRVLSMPFPEKEPVISDEVYELFVNLAQTTAMMRGVVERDRFTQQVIYKPAIEVGTRLAKQLAKLAVGIAAYRQERDITPEVYGIVCRVALDTAPDRVEEIVRRIWEGCPNPEDSMKTSEVSARTRLPIATCFRVLQDLELLQLVDRVGTGNKYEWRVARKLLQLIEDGKVYTRSKPEHN